MKQSLDQIFKVNQPQKPSLDELFGKAPVEQPKQNYGQRLMGQYDSARKDIGGAIERGASGEQNLLSTGLQTVGSVARAAFAPLTAAVEPALQPVIEKVAQIPGVQNVIGKVTEFAQKNPELARNVESVVDIAGLGVGSQGVRVGKEIGNVAKDATIATRNIASKGLKATGEKIQQTVIKPSVRDISDGFKIENVAKYDVGGSLPTTIAKTHTKMNELTTQLKEKLTSSDAKIDLNKVYQDTVDNLMSQKSRSFGDNEAIKRQIDALRAEIDSLPTEGGLVDLYDATNIKRGAGTKGAWAYNRPEVDASATEKIYTQFYDVLKNEIEKSAPDGVKEINKQLSELIPINNAAMRRLPVAERNNALSLTDTIGLTSSVFDPKALLIMGANKASKSGRVGQALVKAGEALKTAPRIKGTPKPGISERSPILKSIGEYIKNPKMGLSIEDVSKKIDNVDKSIMIKYADEYATGKLSKDTAKAMQDLADLMDLPSRFKTTRALYEDVVKVLDLARNKAKKL